MIKLHGRGYVLQRTPRTVRCFTRKTSEDTAPAKLARLRVYAVTQLTREYSFHEHGKSEVIRIWMFLNQQFVTTLFKAVITPVIIF